MEATRRRLPATAADRQLQKQTRDSCNVITIKNTSHPAAAGASDLILQMAMEDAHRND